MSGIRTATVILCTCGLAATGCVRSVEPPEPADLTVAAEPTESSLPLEQLRALGYVEHVEQPLENARDGVVVFREGRVAEGYFLTECELRDTR